MNWPRWSLADVMARRPPIRINQVGYAADLPKRATLLSDAPSPVPFVVRSTDGTLLRGRSTPWSTRPEPTSGRCVHVLDFSALSANVTTCWIEAEDTCSHEVRIGTDACARLASDALDFFRAMRCRHADTDVPAWSGPEAARLYPQWSCPGRFDVSGGWYDAGDYGKYVTSGAVAVWQLLRTLRLPVPDEVAWRVVEEARWQLDWLLRMQVPQGSPLAGTAFHRVHGTTWSPLPGRPEDDPTRRVLHRPSTPATFQLAAVAAHAARLLHDYDDAYAARLLAAARTAYDAARRHPDLLPPDDHAAYGGGPYGDDDATDDAYWAAAELWLTTGEERFARDARSSTWWSEPPDPCGFDGDRVATCATLDLAGATDPELATHPRERILAGAERLLAVQRAQPWGQPYAPAAGWEWGSNGQLLNHLVVLGEAHLLTADDRYLWGVAEGIDHVLGRNALGQCYVTGHGTDDSRHQRTRQFGHDLDASLPPVPRGALAGGPCSQPSPDFPYDDRLRGLAPQLCYLDEPTSEVTNDVCIRWNAPLVWVAQLLATR